MRSRALLAVLALSLCGCFLVSEQTGQLIPDGDPRFWDGKLGDVVIHFDSTYNKGLLFLRTVGMLGFAWWVWNTERRSSSKVLTLALAAPLTLAAVVLLVRDFPMVRSYRIAMKASGLEMRIPPRTRIDVPWSQVEGLHVSGVEWHTGAATPGGRAGNKDRTFLDLPEWETMELSLTDGTKTTVDLTRLSIEQRGTVFKTIATRAGLQKR